MVSPCLLDMQDTRTWSGHRYRRTPCSQVSRTASVPTPSPTIPPMTLRRIRLLPVFRDPRAWRVLDAVMAMFMLGLCLLLLVQPLPRNAA